MNDFIIDGVQCKQNHTISCKQSVDCAGMTAGSMKLTNGNGLSDCDSIGDPASPVTDPDELALLEKLLIANRMLEADSRSLHSLSSRGQRRLSPGSNDHVTDGLSRRDSLSSVLSATSVSSVSSNVHGEDAHGTDTLECLWALWGNIVNEWDGASKRKSSHLKELVRRGIPHHFRGIAWQLLCGVDQDSQEKKFYSEYIKMTSPFEKTIGRDITRTFPGHDLFKDKDGLGQESLFNVMKAYSLHDREVGYCQGSAFIAGLLLMQMPEEEAFAVLVKIMSVYNLRELFKPSMAELGLRMFQLENLIKDQLPELYNHFQTQGIATSMFASSWFLALFTTVLPLPLACRVFDAFLLEGLEIVFRVGIAILQLNLEDLLALDMEETIKFLQKDLSVKPASDPESLMFAAYQVKYNARKLKRVEKEYAAMKTKELEEQVELRRLRTENKLLQQRIGNLEKETETLADRLIQDQVKCAQQEEHITVLRQRIAATKRDATGDQMQLNDVLTSLPSHPDGLASSFISRVSSWSTPLFGPRDKSRKSEQLQQELEDANVILVRLKSRLNNLETENQALRRDHGLAISQADVQELHNELIACKLREAEANMASKQLQNELFEIERLWQRYRDRSTELNSSDVQHQVSDTMMADRLREADLVCQLTETRQSLLLAEQQNAATERRNEQLVCDNESLKRVIAVLQQEKIEAENHLQASVLDLQIKHKEEMMLAKLRDSEHSQLVTEMRRRIAELEIQNEDLVRDKRCKQHSGSPIDCVSNGNECRLEADGSSPIFAEYASLTPSVVDAPVEPVPANRDGMSLQFKYNASVSSSTLGVVDLTPTNDASDTTSSFDASLQVSAVRPVP